MPSSLLGPAAPSSLLSSLCEPQPGLCTLLLPSSRAAGAAAAEPLPGRRVQGRAQLLGSWRQQALQDQEEQQVKARGVLPGSAATETRR